MAKGFVLIAVEEDDLSEAIQALEKHGSTKHLAAKLRSHLHLWSYEDVQRDFHRLFIRWISKLYRRRQLELKATRKQIG